MQRLATDPHKAGNPACPRNDLHHATTPLAAGRASTGGPGLRSAIRFSCVHSQHRAKRRPDLRENVFQSYREFDRVVVFPACSRRLPETPRAWGGAFSMMTGSGRGSSVSPAKPMVPRRDCRTRPPAFREYVDRLPKREPL